MSSPPEATTTTVPPLTEAELATLRKVWYEVTRTQSNSFGANVFLRMFEIHPGYLPLFGFKATQPVHDEAFRTCTKLAAHGANVMYMLNMVFDNLDDIEMVDELLSKLVSSHVRRGIEPQMFDDIVEPFNTVIRQSGQFTPAEVDTIERAFLFVKNRIQHGYEDVDGEDLFDDDSMSSYSDTDNLLI